MSAWNVLCAQHAQVSIPSNVITYSAEALFVARCAVNDSVIAQMIAVTQTTKPVVDGHARWSARDQAVAESEHPRDVCRSSCCSGRWTCWLIALPHCHGGALQTNQTLCRACQAARMRLLLRTAQPPSKLTAKPETAPVLFPLWCVLSLATSIDTCVVAQARYHARCSSIVAVW